MLENDLRIRSKFISKLITKIEDLNNNFILLSKVDNKILKKMNNQIGREMNNQIGGDANSAILVALKKQQEMKEQQKKITENLNKLQNIEAEINNFNTTFDNIKNTIDTIQLGDFNNLENLKTFATLNNNTLNQSDIDLLKNLLDNDKYYDMTFKEFTEDSISKVLKTKIDEDQFKILFKGEFKDDEVGGVISDSVVRTPLAKNPTPMLSVQQKLERARKARKARAAIKDKGND
jgi:hypothetical protein